MDLAAVGGLRVAVRTAPRVGRSGSPAGASYKDGRVKAAQAAYLIDRMLMKHVAQEHRVAVLEFSRAGYDGETGRFIGRAPHRHAAIRCLDCRSPLCEHCEFRGMKNGEQLA